MNKKQISHWLKVAVIGIALGFALQFVRAWTEPTAAPPNGNVGAPINTSANPQTKAGNFTSNGIISAGDQFCLRGVCISTWPSGTTPPPACTCNGAACGSTYTSGSCMDCSCAMNNVSIYTCVNSSWALTGYYTCPCYSCG